MPDSSNSHQPAVCSETMSNNNSSGDSNKKSSVQIDLGEVTQHNIKVLKKVNQVKDKVWKTRVILRKKKHMIEKHCQVG